MIQATALKMVFDILLLYGTEMFRSGVKDDGTDDDDDVTQGSDDDYDDDVIANLSFPDEAVGKRQDGDKATQKLLRILVDFLDHEVLKNSEMITLA